MNDPYNLARFITAQESTYDNAQIELSVGRKTSHWMWFIFPQIKGLGQSEAAKLYSIQSLEEAEAYFHHKILGSRLIACTSLVNTHTQKTAHEIFDSPDDMKFRSCMTLFALAAPKQTIFAQAIDNFFEGKKDWLTLCLVSED